MAKLGSSIDARLSRISPYAIRAIEQGGAAMGDAYSSIGASAAKAIRSYADMKKEQRLTDEEKEEEVQKDKSAINYIRKLINPETGERYTAVKARDLVKGIGRDKAVSQIAAQKNVADQIKATADLANAERVAAAELAQADSYDRMITSINGQVTSLNIAIGNNKTQLEIARNRNENETQKQVYIAQIAALEADKKVLTDKSSAIEANNKLLTDGRTALQNIANANWMKEATPAMQTEAYNTVKKAQAGFIGGSYGNFDNVVGWNITNPDGSIVRKPPSSWIKLQTRMQDPNAVFNSDALDDSGGLDDSGALDDSGGLDDKSFSNAPYAPFTPSGDKGFLHSPLATEFTKRDIVKNFIDGVMPAPETFKRLTPGQFGRLTKNIEQSENKGPLAGVDLSKFVNMDEDEDVNQSLISLITSFRND